MPDSTAAARRAPLPTPDDPGRGAGDPATPAVGGALPSDAAVLARASGENFIVASRLLPRRSRTALLAFYGYARLVDQIGDAVEGDRNAALDWVAGQLDTALSGAPGAAPLVADAVAATLESGADPSLLRDLIGANRQDQTRTRYETYDELLAYCRLSANPVGRLVLGAFGASTPQRETWSDAVCTGLQLAEHWQDVAEDARAGRIYLPLEDLRRFSIDEDEVLDTSARGGPASTPLRALIGFETARARTLLQAGAPLVASLRGRARLAVAGYVAGGLAALDAVAAARFDPFAGPPRAPKARVAARTAALLLQAHPRSAPGGRP
ncbi:MAG TPA: squalene synthase HpnC [Acidimicrobiales bacterium]|nr:squalene synthase HpnC [Acidimicrobiales bacterium]